MLGASNYNHKPRLITINNFNVIEEPDRIPYIPWHNIKEVMPPEMFARFAEVSIGSTSYIEGFYKHDMEKFLRLYKQQ